MIREADAPQVQVTLKLATSLDGRIATASGESRWITGEASRTEAHTLRAAHDAVLVGSETALKDDPELTVRLDPPPMRQPVRIVADSRGRLRADARIFATADLGPVAIATLETTDIDALNWPAHRNVHYWMLPADSESSSLSLSFLMAACAGSGVTTLMVEGGGTLAAAFMRRGLVSRIEWFRAPVLLGSEGTPCLGGLQLGALGDAPRFQRTALRDLGEDVWESYVRA
jgi:diaminohydroxyphosphoribosylaminopyrimidine deaminase / 5-amino-6-(5-phosphoribosylamino)uracil reductase